MPQSPQARISKASLLLVTVVFVPFLLPTFAGASTDVHYLTQAAFILVGTFACLAFVDFRVPRTVVLSVVGATAITVGIHLHAANDIATTSAVMREAAKWALFPAAAYLVPRALVVAGHRRQGVLRTLLYALIGLQIASCAVQLFAPDLWVHQAWFSADKLSSYGLGSGKIRLLGSLENPNYLAFAACAVGGAIAAVERSPWRVGLAWMLVLMLVLLSGSRAGIISAAFLALTLTRRHIGLWRLGLIAVLVTVVYLTYTETFGPRFLALMGTEALRADSSFATRLEVNLLALELVGSRPLLGYGESPIDITDNLLTLLALRFGILGTLTLVSLCMYCFVQGVKRSAHDQDVATSPRFAVAFTYLISITPFILTGAYIDNMRLYWIFMVAAAIATLPRASRLVEQHPQARQSATVRSLGNSQR